MSVFTACKQLVLSLLLRFQMFDFQKIFMTAHMVCLQCAKFLTMILFTWQISDIQGRWWFCVWRAEFWSFTDYGFWICNLVYSWNLVWATDHPALHIRGLSLTVAWKSFICILCGLPHLSLLQICIILVECSHKLDYSWVCFA